MKVSTSQTFRNERQVSFGSGLPTIPERLLLSHARGGVLFVAGAGVSRPSKLPDFRGLVIGVYARLDTAIHSVLSSLPADTNSIDYSKFSTLSDRQIAEVKRYIVGDYDVVLGMLERRIDGETKDTFRLRQTVECE